MLENLEQQVRALQGRLDHYHKQKLKKSQNICSIIIETVALTIECFNLQVEPDVESITQFCTNLWANSMLPHNHHSDWLVTLKCLFAETVHEHEGFIVTPALVSHTVRNFAN